MQVKEKYDIEESLFVEDMVGSNADEDFYVEGEIVFFVNVNKGEDEKVWGAFDLKGWDIYIDLLEVYDEKGIASTYKYPQDKDKIKEIKEEKRAILDRFCEKKIDEDMYYWNNN